MRMLRIGVTGGIGSGKTTVCQFFEDLGLPVLYADKIAKSLSETNPRIRSAIRRLLGRQAYTSGGKLNRQYIADSIFGNDRLVRRMNAIIHPVVERQIIRELNRLERQSKKIAVVEAALIFEAGLDRYLDLVVVVHTDIQKRKGRANKRSGFSAKDILRRQKAQWPVAAKLKLADVVIENNGTRNQLKQKVKLLHKIFLHLIDRENS